MEEVTELIQQKDQLYKQFLSNRTEDNYYTKYKEKNKVVRNTTKREKKNRGVERILQQSVNRNKNRIPQPGHRAEGEQGIRTDKKGRPTGVSIADKGQKVGRTGGYTSSASQMWG